MEATLTTGGPFQINNAKLYAPAVALSINDNIKFLEDIKQGFKRIICWNKYRSELTIQPKKNNLDYLIDSIFRNLDRSFVISIKNGNDDPARNSFDKYYMPLVEIKDFSSLIDDKSFFDQPVKSKQELYEKRIEMSRNNDCTKGNSLDFSYNQNYYKLSCIDLSRQTNTSITQKISFTGELEENNGATVKMIITEKQQKTILNFSLDSLIVIE